MCASSYKSKQHLNYLENWVSVLLSKRADRRVDFCFVFVFFLFQFHWWIFHKEMKTWIRIIIIIFLNTWSVHFSVPSLKWPPFVCSPALSPPNNWTWKAHRFRNGEPLTLTHHMSKQTNSLTGGSCEPAVGSTAVVFEDNAPSLCSPHHRVSCLRFSSAQLSAANGYSLKSQAHAHGQTRARAHTHACLYFCICGGFSRNAIVWPLPKPSQLTPKTPHLNPVPTSALKPANS